MDIENVLKEFFANQWPPTEPLLLALSGGPDSMALFHLLLKENRKFHVAHVDHKWRKESGEEAEYLAHLCQQKGVIFHLHTLESKALSGNLEDVARKERLHFFQTLCTKHSLKAVLLAHHATDLAETVLKRVLEGASLPKLKGLSAISTYETLTLLRPLLSLTKEEIMRWLKKESIAYFVDPTNTDPHFLRARMRIEIVPHLSQLFGKEVSASLCRIGEASQELHQFLEEMLIPFKSCIRNEERGIILDLRDKMPDSQFLKKAILRDFFSMETLTLSHAVLETLLFHLQRKQGVKNIQVGKREIEIDRGKILIKKIVRTVYTESA